MLMWLVLGVAVWWFFRPRRRVPPPQRAAPPPAARAIVQAEPMVDCAHCGLHLPTSEALRDTQARLYCSTEHRAAGPRRAG